MKKNNNGNIDIGEMLENFDEDVLDGDEAIEVDDEELDDDAVEDEVDDADDDSDDSGDDDSDDGDDAEGDEDGEDEIALLKAQLAERDATITEIAKGRIAKPAGDDEDKDEPFQIADDPWKEDDFLGEDFDIGDLTAEKLNALLNSAASAGAKFGASHGAKQVLLSIPDIVKHNVSMQNTIQGAISEFYTNNSDLLQFKGSVSAVTQELASANPGWELPKLFEAAGKETRKRLGIKKTGKKKKATTKKTIRSQRGKGKAKQLAGLEQELGDMLDA